MVRIQRTKSWFNARMSEVESSPPHTTSYLRKRKKGGAKQRINRRK